MNRSCYTTVIATALASLSLLTQAGDLKFSRHFSNNMVLQRDKPVTIRGFADKGANVTITFGSQKKEATADDNGIWAVSLDPMPANSKPQSLTASTPDTRHSTLDNVVVGDVFLFARQTAIDVSLNRDDAGRKAAAEMSETTTVRVMKIKTAPSEDPQLDLAKEATSGWTVLNKESALTMNAAAFYVAKDLASKSEVPVGIIDLNMGYHFPIAWLSRDALMETTKVFGEKEKTVSTMMEMMDDALAKFNNEEARKKMDESRPGPAPHPREDARFPAAGYNAVLHPMRGLALKGLLLQLGNDYPYVLYEDLVRSGKKTSRPHLGQVYKDTYDVRKWCIYLEPVTIPRMPRELRKIFADELLPIGWIMPPGSDLVTMGRHHYEMRELQRRTSEQEKGVDLIHPGTEHIPFSAQPADEKLLSSRCLTYLDGAVYKKEGVAPTGPIFDRVVTDYSRAQVFFKAGTATGLKAQAGALDQFEVAGRDLEFSKAKATIDGETIRLKSDNVLSIKHVRYNWTIKPDQGLTSANGLPAVPFNTDGHEYPKKINTLGEEPLPEEFSTPVTEWKGKGAVFVNGRLTKDPMGGKPLGPTGLKVSTFGPNLFVNNAYIGSPADGKIFHGDYIYAVNGELLKDDIMKQMAEAITQAETEEGKGIISFDLVRNGEKKTVTLQLEVLGSFSPTSPYECPKTDRIVANAEAFLGKYGGVVPSHPVFMNADAMFLLAAGSPEYQGLVRRHVYSRMAGTDLNQPIDPNAKDPKPQGGPWDLSADILLMSEYYLATGDRAVLPYLRYTCDTLTSLQIRDLGESGPWPQVQAGQTGGWRHNFYGGATYGTMPAVGVPASLGYQLTKEAGVQYNFEGCERAANWFLHNGAKIGSIYYGYSAEPRTAGNTVDPAKLAAGKLDPGNGGVAGAAILFNLRGNGPVARTCSFVSTYSFDNTSYAHGGNFWCNLYTPLGAKVHNKEAFQFFMKGNRWYQELNRMYNHSRDQGYKDLAVGQYLAYTAPRERLRILGAHESVFSPNPPEFLKPALDAYLLRDYATCEKAAAAVIDKGGIYGLELQKTEQLREAAALMQKSIAHDLARVKKLIAEGKPYEAGLDIAQLEAVMPEGNDELVAIETTLGDPALSDAIAQDSKRYNAYIKSLALKLPGVKKEGEGEWKSLVKRGETTWRMKILESLDQAPEGWTKTDFNDGDWTETKLPISWHTNHTAVLRVPFEITDKDSVNSLRLEQWAFRQEDIRIYINGTMVAKVSASGSGGKAITFPLNDHAVKALKNGRNVLAATYKHTWRWGRYFANAETERKTSVYNNGVHLNLDMQETK